MPREEKAATVVRSGFDEDNWDITTPEKNELCPNNQPLIKWATKNWWVNYQCNWSEEWKKWWTYVWGGGDEPQYNCNFDPKRFFLWTSDPKDQVPLLELKAFKPPGDEAWIASEIVLEDLLGYGHYLVTAKTAGDFGNLDPWVVFGIFTYQWGDANVAQEGGDNRKREIDLLETIAGERQTYDNNNAQFALQLATANRENGLIGGQRFTIPANTQYITVYMQRVRPTKDSPRGEVIYKCFAGDYILADVRGNKVTPLLGGTWEVKRNSPYYDKVPLHTQVSRERLHINLYVPGGGYDKDTKSYNPDKAPKSPQSVYLKRFQYEASV
jgi:hypothetical protein